MEPRDLIVLTPLGAADPSLAIAAGRAAARGVLDLEMCRDRAVASKLLAQLARFVHTNFGVQLPADSAELFSLFTNTIKPSSVILAGADHPDLPERIRSLRELGIEVLREVISLSEARHATELGVDGLILKGNEAGGRVGADSSSVLLQQWRQSADQRALKLPIWVRGGVGLSNAAAYLSEGARGVVLDSQVLLARESSLAEPARQRIATLNGSETLIRGAKLGESYRLYSRPDSPSALELAKVEERLQSESLPPEAKLLAWRNAIAERIADDPARGVWLVGQDVESAPALAAKGVTVAGIVQVICADATQQLASARQLNQPTHASSLANPSASESAFQEPEAPPPCDVAIIGLSCFYPKAGSLWTYWENILGKVNAVTEIPFSHWDWRLYYDPDPRAKDKMISKWGGFLGDTPFDPLTFGITPKSLPNIEPLQLLLLEAVRQALADAGYLDVQPGGRDPGARGRIEGSKGSLPGESRTSISAGTGSWRLAQVADRTCAILGIGGGGMPLSVSYGFRSCMPLMDTIPGVKTKSSEVIALGEGILPEWTEDSFPGILLNVASGRVANRFNLGGPNMAIDAACGSSLAALYAGVRELNNGTSDVAVVMGADAVQTPYAYVAFSKTHALSPRGRCRPFDAEADGIVLAEGIGVAVLKRLADAERDGDRIYAVIKGVGASSDGRDKGLTAPRAEGQLRALHRAYAQARLSPARVGLVEAHGTGTVVGDQTEARAIGQLFREAGGNAQSCAVGSVKSMIGHSKCAAGLAGLIKTAFALHHKILPPTLVEKPNPKANLEGGPLYLNIEARPWVNGAQHPRTAGVSAFGFGGTNFHTVLEEYTGDFLNRPNSGLRHWPAELFVWRRSDVNTLRADVAKCRDALSAGATPELADLAASVWQSSRISPSPQQGEGGERSEPGEGQPLLLAVVASSLDDLKDKLDSALAILSKGDTYTDPRGIYLAATPATPQAAKVAKVAFLFPGQGSQYPDMLSQVTMAFPEVRQTLDRAEATLANDLEKPLGRLIYPPSAFTPEQEAANRDQLRRTEVAQSSIGATSLAMFRLLSALGVEADFFAGHSYGEYVALTAAGALSEEDLLRLSYRRGRAIREAAKTAPGGMIAADNSAEAIEPVLKGIADVWIANHNSPTQTVIAGTEAGVKLAAEKLQAAGIRSQRIAVACGFHSPLIAGAKPALADALAKAKFTPPRKPVYSNTSAAQHPADGVAIARQLAEHLISPVRFADEIRAMYDAGARVFIEVGPQAVLTGLTSQILTGQPHLAIATDVKTRPGLVQLTHVFGQLLAAGVAVNLDRLFQGRGVQPFELATLGPDTGKPKLSPTTWVVNGVRSRPLNGPEPRLLGQPLEMLAKSAPKNQSETPKIETAPKTKPAIQESSPRPVTPAAPVAGTKPPGLSNLIPPPGATTPPRAKMNMNENQPALPLASANGHAQPAPDGATAVMMRFQEVMARFLDTQRSVMLSFLGASNGTDAPSTPDYAPRPSANGQSTPLPTPFGATNRLIAEAPREQTPRVVIPEPTTNGHASTHPAPTPVTSPALEANGKPTPAQEPAPAKPGAEALNREVLLARLLDLVSDRTGYPKEALSIDLDLEADLGVDSIKRVEILGALAESIEASVDGKQPNLEMEKLSVIKTLRGIADYVTEAIGTSTTEPSANGKHDGPPPTASSQELHPGARQGEVQRLVVRLIDTPLPVRPRFTPPSGTILITDDRLGTAQELADRLAELGAKTALVRMAEPGESKDRAFAADLTDPTAVTELLARVRETCGPVSGLIHLLPLAEPPTDETAEQRTRREVKSLYLLARGLETEIRDSGKNGPAVLLSVTAMGGTMGFGADLPTDFFAGHGGVAGFTKCLGFEWPEVTVRVVDVSSNIPATQLAEQLLAELGDPEGPFEVGRNGDQRVTWQVEPGPLDKETPAVELGPDSTILITGGARGITAKVALELAERYGSKLVLVGSSPEPTPEAADTASLSSQAEIKAALLKHEPNAKPAAIESAYKRLLKDREMRGNLEAIRATGSKVEYRVVDVRDPAAFGALLDELNSSGGITGVIHGAGVIEDKLLRDKTPESFDRVFGTKVDSSLLLARKLDPAKLKFFALFASITSRYGNRGQSDYAAANELLSKLACDLDRKWPGRVVSVAWGPWAKVGMVADLEKHLVARGLKLIEPAVGAGFAVDEVIFGAKGEPEVLIAGGNEQAARPGKIAEPVAVGAE
ncbi:MAG: acyltransferase domain-containing protein [Planctomycetia bacterium]|nr:acyltransferase domain-containing protein [Planctomycetia bacterium]